MPREILPVVGCLAGEMFGCNAYIGGEPVGPWVDPHPPGEAERLANALTEQHGDPIESLRRLHATPCRANFTGLGG